MLLLVSRFRKLLDFTIVPAAESRELNTKLINPKECLDFLGRYCYWGGEDVEGGHEGGGKAFRSLSAPPSRMLRRTYMWLLNPTIYNIYIYTRARTHTHTISHVFANSSSDRCECANAHLLAAYISDTRRLAKQFLLPISKRCSKQLKNVFKHLFS